MRGEKRKEGRKWDEGCLEVMSLELRCEWMAAEEGSWLVG
jgi:hypothetical protein